jgi:putative transposase
VLRLQAFKFELTPNGQQQQRDMRSFAGARRFVFNKALAMQIANHEAGGKFLSYNTLAGHLTAWRNSAETPWLKDVPYHTSQQALKDLERAYRNFFAGRADFPTFKKKGFSSGFRYPDAKQFKLDPANRRVFLPKLGWMQARYSREILGAPKNLTVGYRGGKWFMSVQTEREVGQPVPTSRKAIGADAGVVHHTTLSDGSFIDLPDRVKKLDRALRVAQQRLSHKTKFSKNWKKAKARVQRIHTLIANIRRNFLHQTSHTLSKNHALVCIENLPVANMTKSAKGTVENPGKNVRQKAGLNRAIQTQGWREFRRQLEYKLAWRGGWLIAVPPHNTSRTCPACGHVAAENRKTQAQFCCVECGFHENADVVGAINVLNRGLKLFEGQDTADASAGWEVTPAARIACEVNGAARPSAAGTHRSESARASRPS